MAAPSEQQLWWSSNGVPHVGSGIGWMEPDFVPRGWSTGNLPAGYGFGGLSTDLTTTMRDKTPSLYLRKEFELTAVQAALSDPLTLVAEYNDGFLAYLYGREMARVNFGPTKRFIYASQPALNVSTASGPVENNLRPGKALVVPRRHEL